MLSTIEGGSRLVLFGNEFDASRVARNGTATRRIGRPEEFQVIYPPVALGDLAVLSAALGEPDPDLHAVFKALSVRNRAIGVLIDQGNAPDQAPMELHRRAVRDGVTIDRTAQDILDTLTMPVRPGWSEHAQTRSIQAETERDDVPD